jgi:hypothetical protein
MGGPGVGHCNQPPALQGPHVNRSIHGSWRLHAKGREAQRAGGFETLLLFAVLLFRVLSFAYVGLKQQLYVVHAGGNW